MDWSQATIPIGKQRVILQPEPKSKFTVFPSDDPKAHILYHDCQFGNYMILSNSEVEGDSSQNEGKEILWLMEFDDSCVASGSGAGVVLIPPSSNAIPFSFKLEFKNTNNTAEYEALLLGLAEAKRLGLKLLRVKGDVELIIK
ncbi:uncharacterized protein LOC131856154 [Cryptomeria japonica]|uniref:uncharacterized protein LOC131856154 n=1 Tax=Cryptomeria japonica TaxID=3369 RepID=UPI0027DA938B|nr:uncharacterized protein LOC131856154 [Cryptomeria japonica]